MLVFQDYARLKCVEWFVVRLPPQSLDRAQCIVVLKIVPVDRGRIEIGFRPAVTERDQFLPLRARAIVVTQLCLDLAGSRAIIRYGWSSVGQSVCGRARLLQRFAIVLAKRSSETDQTFGKLRRIRVEGVQVPGSA